MSSDAGGIRAGRAFVELLLAGEEKFRAGLERAEHRLKQLGRAVSEIGRTVVAGGALLAAPFAVALKIFDAAGQKIHDFQREAARAGVAVDPQQLRAAWDFAQAFNILKVSVKVLAIEVASALAPALQETFAWLTRMVHGIGLWARAHPAVIQQLAKMAVGLTVAGVALVTLGHAMKVTSAVLKLVSFGLGAARVLLTGLTVALGVAQTVWAALTSVIAGMGAVSALALSPVALLTLAVNALPLALVAGGVAWLASARSGHEALGRLTSGFSDLAGTARTTFAAVSDALSIGDLTGAAEAGLAGLEMAWLDATVGIRKAWINTWASIQDISVSGLEQSHGAWEAFVSTLVGASLQFIAAVDSAAAAVLRVQEDLVAQIAGWLMGLAEAAQKIGLAGADTAEDIATDINHDAARHENSRRLDATADAARKAAENPEGTAREAGLIPSLGFDPQHELGQIYGQRDERLKELQQQYDEAHQQFQAKYGAAALAAAAGAAAGAGADTNPNPLALKSDVHGTFSAAAVGALGSTKANEMTDLLRDGNRKLDRINNTLQKTGKTT